MSNEEIFRALASKFLRGDIPYDVYVKLRDTYSSFSKEIKDDKKSNKQDIAYL